MQASTFQPLDRPFVSHTPQGILRLCPNLSRSYNRILPVTIRSSTVIGGDRWFSHPPHPVHPKPTLSEPLVVALVSNLTYTTCWLHPPFHNNSIPVSARQPSTNADTNGSWLHRCQTATGRRNQINAPQSLTADQPPSETSRLVREEGISTYDKMDTLLLFT